MDVCYIPVLILGPFIQVFIPSLEFSVKFIALPSYNKTQKLRPDLANLSRFLLLIRDGASVWV